MAGGGHCPDLMRFSAQSLWPVAGRQKGGLGISARGDQAEVPEQTCAQSSPATLESGSLDHLSSPTSGPHPHSTSLRLSEFTEESNKCFPEPLACLHFLYVLDFHRSVWLLQPLPLAALTRLTRSNTEWQSLPHSCDLLCSTTPTLEESEPLCLHS